VHRGGFGAKSTVAALLMIAIEAANGVCVMRLCWLALVYCPGCFIWCEYSMVLYGCQGFNMVQISVKLCIRVSCGSERSNS
jgi:hypothetical protein